MIMKQFKKMLTVLLVLVCMSAVVLTGVSSAATLHFTTIDIPGAPNIVVQTITPGGEVLGYYITTDTGHQYGFVWTKEDGVVNIAPPAGTFTVTMPVAINSKGEVIGQYEDPYGITHGFLWTKKDGFKTIDPPAALYTYPVAITKNGEITGYYSDSSGQSHGFVITPR
jgi:uncharacterized membrane protein